MQFNFALHLILLDMDTFWHLIQRQSHYFKEKYYWWPNSYKSNKTIVIASGFLVTDSMCKHTDTLRHLQDFWIFTRLWCQLLKTLWTLGKLSLMIHCMQTWKKLWFRLRDIKYKQTLMEKQAFESLSYVCWCLHH